MISIEKCKQMGSSLLHFANIALWTPPITCLSTLKIYTYVGAPSTCFFMIERFLLDAFPSLRGLQCLPPPHTLRDLSLHRHRHDVRRPLRLPPFSRSFHARNITILNIAAGDIVVAQPSLIMSLPSSSTYQRRLFEPLFQPSQICSKS